MRDLIIVVAVLLGIAISSVYYVQNREIGILVCKVGEEDIFHEKVIKFSTEGSTVKYRYKASTGEKIRVARLLKNDEICTLYP